MDRKEQYVEQPFEFRDRNDAAKLIKDHIHIYHNNAVCETDTKGYRTPENRSSDELVVDSSEGFIPLWAENVTLRWRFQDQSMAIFVNPEAAKNAIRKLFAEGLLLWGDSTPVRFTERHDAWDFEIAVNPQENCTINGCTLARAFFPDAGRHDLLIYPTMFSQSRQEQIETLAHEIGHVFGLRHFFADVSETAFPVEIFGEHDKFSIMNYGPDSKLTDNDRADLILLYDQVWSGRLTNINGTPIEQMRPFSSFRLARRGGNPFAIA